MGERQHFVLYVLVCLEIGIFLILVPWSVMWERNYFLETLPALRPIMLSSVLRGAVAGLGLANIYMALREVIVRRQETVVGGRGVEPAREGRERSETGSEAQRPRKTLVATEDRS
ncbi:MAG TPA: hypothetical protein VEK15_23700 [Vicinamibacteria bacterium]|nr:hypothetical protein [Vicinamibacteria bacterium]